MARKGRISIRNLLKEGSESFRRLNEARVEDELARGPVPLTKRHKQASLERKAENKAGMVNIPGPVHCRILRICGKRAKIYDDDNYTGGLKECRDAIAAALGLKGDSPEDGITFEYVQKVDKTTDQSKMEIEIYA